MIIINKRSIKIMKKLLTIVCMCFLMFMFGRFTTSSDNDISDNIDSLSTSYVIEGNYIESNIDINPKPYI